jgi:hypothetical protein
LNPERRAIDLAHQHEKRVKICWFLLYYERSGVSFQVGDMGSRGNHVDFCLFKKPSHIWRPLLVKHLKTICALTEIAHLKFKIHFIPARGRR